MGVRIGKAIVVLGITASAAGIGGYHVYKKATTPKPGTQVVLPLPQRNLLLGVFVNHYTDAAHLNCMEATLGQRIDLSLRFVPLREIYRSPATSFPREEAELMKGRNGSLYLRVKIGPKDLAAGSYVKYAKALKGFAKAARAYGGPVLLEPYFDREASRAAPEVKDGILKLVVDSLAGAGNITWVWNAALGKQPPGLNSQWTSLNLTQRKEKGKEKWPTFDEILGSQLNNLGTNQAVILFVASTAPEGSKAKADFIKRALEIAMQKENIKGIILFHAPIIEGSRLMSAPLFRTTLENLRAQLSENEGFFSSDVFGNQETRPLPKKGKEECETTMSEFYTPHEALAKRYIGETITQIERKLKEFKGSEQEAPLREALAQKYVELAGLEKDEAKSLAYLEKAHATLQAAFKNLREVKEKGKTPKRFPIVKKHFDLKLQLAALYSRRGENRTAEKLQAEVLKELEDNQALLEQQVNKYMKDGYKHRAYLELGLVCEKLKKRERARELFAQVDKWATPESKKSKLVLFWKGESRFKLRYLAAQARLGLVRIAFSQGEKPDTKSIDKLIDILSWEEAGRQDGFMDLGIGAFISIMKAYLLEDPQNAAAKFNERLPWKTIDAHRDLKKALGIEETDLTSPYVNKWKEVLEGLLNAKLHDKGMQSDLMYVRDNYHE